MILYSPEILKKNGRVCVSARFELETAKFRGPNTLWFSFPEKYSQFSTGRADGFAASLLLLAMLYGEDIEVCSTLSPRLVHGMEEYQRIFNSWLPERFKLVNIKCTSYERSHLSDQNNNVGCAFSGGVDSFYTLWSHLPQNEPKVGYQISHALFIHGYDIPLTEEVTYDIAWRAYDEMLRGLGLELVTGKTNVHQIVSPTVGWEWAHGAALIGVPLILDGLFARFYVPGTHTYADAFPWGSDPRLDHLLSTETLDVIHDGAAIPRVEKTATIAQWPETYSRLRVCWVKLDGLKNCCRCSKCVRTMTTLEVLGALSRYTTFPLPLTRQDIRRCRFLDEDERIFARHALTHAVRLGKKEVASDLQYALFQSHANTRAKQISNLIKQIVLKPKQLWRKIAVSHRMANVLRKQQP
jgi:hypothetical protein